MQKPKPYNPVNPNKPAVPPDNAAIDILQYSTTAALFTTADSLYAIISEKERRFSTRE